MGYAEYAEFAEYVGEVVLTTAAVVGAGRVVRWAVERGVDVDKTQNGRVTPLYCACQRGGDGGDLVRLLVEEGNADVDASVFDGKTPLAAAAEHGCVDNVRVLVENGVDVNKECLEGETPLLLALLGEQIEVVEVLIEAGVNVDAYATSRGDYGVTPLVAACGMGGGNVAVEMVRMLVQGGADVDKKTLAGIAPLWVAVREGGVEMVECLLDAGVDVEGAGRTGVGVVEMAEKEDVVALLTEWSNS